MKLLIPSLIAAASLAVPSAAQSPNRSFPQGQAQGRTRQVYLPPIPNWTIGHSQRQGTSQIVEWVPRGQTVQRYNKIITLTTFVPRPGATLHGVLNDFAQRFRVACPRASVAPITLTSGYRGVRIDCPRNPRTGKPETVFARTVSAYPAMAIVQYMTTYFAMPGEAAQAREFLGRVGVR